MKPGGYSIKCPEVMAYSEIKKPDRVGEDYENLIGSGWIDRPILF